MWKQTTNVLCGNKQQSGSMPILPTLDRHTFQNVGLEKKEKKEAYISAKTHMEAS